MINVINKIVCKLVIILSLSIIAYPQKDNLPFFITQGLDDYIEEKMKVWQIPGMAVGIVKNGKIVHMKGYGVRTMNKPEIVDENTIFMLASVSKSFTAVTLSILEQEGKLTLEDKVIKWIPELKMKDPYLTKELTIADLLSHRTGLRSYQGDLYFTGHNISPKNIIEKMAELDATYPIRTKYGYSNAAFVIAGEVASRANGKSVEKTVKEKILDPLKMNRTLMSVKEIPRRTNVSSPHDFVGDEVEPIAYIHVDNPAPRSLMSSSVADMCKWMLTLLNKGKSFDGKQLIPAKTTNNVWKPYLFHRINRSRTANSHLMMRGLGFRIIDYRGKMQFSKAGNIDGFTLNHMFIPEEELGIVVLTNAYDHNFHMDLSNIIRDAFMNAPLKDYSARTLPFYQKLREDFKRDLERKRKSFRERVKETDKTSIDTTKFAGRYLNNFLGEITIKSNKEEGLDLYFPLYPKLVGKLEYLGKGEFLCTFSDPVFGLVILPFKMEGNKVKSFVLEVTDFEETEYIFEKTE